MPSEDSKASLAERIEQLEREELLRRPVRRLDDDFWARRRPADPEGAVRAALAAVRRRGP